MVENDVTINDVPGVPPETRFRSMRTSGKTNLNGVEIEATVVPLRGLTIDTAFGYTPSDIKEYVCLVCQISVTGNPNVNGHHLAHVPATTFNLGVEYTHPVTADVDGYVRVDWQYQGRIYEDETNLAWIPSSSKVNLRIGATRGNLRLEGYVTNLFDDLTYTNAQLNEDLVHGFINDVVAGLPDRRTFGARLRATF